MVFCYKIITDTPRRSASLSPRRRSPARRDNNAVPSSISQLMGSVDYEDYAEDVLDSIPEREWRLLAALARKREDDMERERLADQFRRLWDQEREERKMVEASTSEQYKRYLHAKRQQEAAWHASLRRQRDRSLEEQQERLQDCIRDKERRAADLRARVDDAKTTELIDKVLEEAARTQLAADRRSRLTAADQWRRQLDVVDTERKAHDARRRKGALLRDASQRLAISNALNLWESSVVRQEISALEAARRARHAARAALTEARAARVARARAARAVRARKVAAFTERLRDAIRTHGTLPTAH